MSYLKRPLDLRGASFKRSNEVLDAVLKGNKAQGYCKSVQHKDVLTEEDKVRLNSYFADVLEADDTYKLQSFCWYNMARHFGLRGGGVFVKLEKKHIMIWTDEDAMSCSSSIQVSSGKSQKVASTGMNSRHAA